MAVNVIKRLSKRWGSPFRHLMDIFELPESLMLYMTISRRRKYLGAVAKPPVLQQTQLDHGDTPTSIYHSSEGISNTMSEEAPVSYLECAKMLLTSDRWMTLHDVADVYPWAKSLSIPSPSSMPRFSEGQNVRYKPVGGPHSLTSESIGTIVSVTTQPTRRAGRNIAASEADPRYQASYT
uniref:Hypervirulence associated protein TUDOR domain-containing protein n=1 Tax=Coccidioides posadasii RMSCC 3488 TaxID=454284 RepID=A0A0J6F3Y8_COCPO|nr:hypothetical protein CPAG_00357 [Coccidioides posadasii RMSCC 3488]